MTSFMLISCNNAIIQCFLELRTAHYHLICVVFDKISENVKTQVNQLSVIQSKKNEGQKKPSFIFLQEISLYIQIMQSSSLLNTGRAIDINQISRQLRNTNHRSGWNDIRIRNNILIRLINIHPKITGTVILF